jgi:hypothetical protein
MAIARRAGEVAGQVRPPQLRPRKVRVSYVRYPSTPRKRDAWLI